jgi:hypothetical protein
MSALSSYSWPATVSHVRLHAHTHTYTDTRPGDMPRGAPHLPRGPRTDAVHSVPVRGKQSPSSTALSPSVSSFFPLARSVVPPLRWPSPTSDAGRPVPLASQGWVPPPLHDFFISSRFQFNLAVTGSSQTSVKQNQVWSPPLLLNLRAPKQCWWAPRHFPPLSQSIPVTSSPDFDLHHRLWRLRTYLWLGFLSGDLVVISEDLSANLETWL